MLPFFYNSFLTAAKAATATVKAATNKTKTDTTDAALSMAYFPANFIIFSIALNAIQQKYINKILSDIPESANSITFTLLEVAAILDVNVETLRRRIRSKDVTAINEDEISGRNGYKISFKTLLALATDLSKNDKLSNWLTFNYPEYYKNYILQYETEYQEFEKKHPQLQIFNALKPKQDIKCSKKACNDSSKTNLESQNGCDTLEEPSKKDSKAEFLKLEIESTKLEIELISQQLGAATTDEEKLNLTKKKVDLQKKLLTLLSK